MSDVFSGATDFLFGEEGREGTPGEVFDLTPEQFEELRGPIRDAILGLLEAPPQFEGPLAAPITPTEEDLLASIAGQTASATGSLNTGRAGLTATAAGGQTNPFLDQAIRAAQRPVIEAFEQTTLPRLRTGFTRAGQLIQPESSSPFDEAVAIASNALLNNLSDISTNISFGSFEAERARQQEAQLGIPAFESGAVQSLVQGLQAQALPRLIEDVGIERGIAQFNQMVNTLLQTIGIGVSAASPRGQTAVIQPTQGTQGTEGNLLPLLAGAAALAFASEEKFKENVVKLGPVPKLKSNLYRWNYIGRPKHEQYVGFMIEEIEKVRPDAISQQGILRTLNYMKLEEEWPEAA